MHVGAKEKIDKNQERSLAILSSVVAGKTTFPTREIFLKNQEFVTFKLDLAKIPKRFEI